jgi:hypothetical protein
VLLYKVLIDVTSWPGPAVNWFVNYVDNLEIFGVFLLERVEFFAEKDIRRRDVRVDESKFGAVGPIG